jgi:hypothetical protein
MTAEKTTNVLIPVTLEVVEGDLVNGAFGGTPTNYKYLVRDMDGDMLSVSLGPKWARNECHHEPAKVGVGYFDTSGEFVLWQADETFGIVDDCK